MIGRTQIPRIDLDSFDRLGLLLDQPPTGNQAVRELFGGLESGTVQRSIFMPSADPVPRKPAVYLSPDAKQLVAAPYARRERMQDILANMDTLRMCFVRWASEGFFVSVHHNQIDHILSLTEPFGGGGKFFDIVYDSATGLPLESARESALQPMAPENRVLLAAYAAIRFSDKDSQIRDFFELQGLEFEAWQVTIDAYRHGASGTLQIDTSDVTMQVI